MNFKSDNTSPVHPQVVKSILAANEGFVGSYGNDPYTLKTKELINSIFERETTSFFVATGTAANCLALQTICPPFGAIFCHEDSHINTDETNAPELFGSGFKLVSVSGHNGKISPQHLVHAIEKHNCMRPHMAMPAAISITQATEAGTVYTIDEIREISKIARHFGLKFHMDGARFSNAIAKLQVSPADLTWKSGIDVLSLGATKNGAMAAECVIFFNPKDIEFGDYQQKRNAQLFSKMRFFSCQFQGWFENNLWLELASHANTRALELAKVLTENQTATLVYPVEANEVFVTMPSYLAEKLSAAGVGFYPWGNPDNNTYRFVTSYCTTSEEINELRKNILEDTPSRQAA